MLELKTDTKYKCVVADPPWKYFNANTKYETMDLEDIKNINVAETTDEEGCVLFIWVTAPMLPNGLDVMSAWGFTYKTYLVWIKSQWYGVGKWFKSNNEICLVGTKGFVRHFNSSASNIIHARPGQGHTKPQEFWDIVSSVTRQHDLTPKVQIFAREHIYGWQEI